MKIRAIIFLFLGVLCCLTTLSQQKRSDDNRVPSRFYTEVPTHLYDIILVRPTNTTITLSLVFYKDAAIRIEYWSQNKKKQTTELIRCDAGEPQNILLNNLSPNTRYNYQIKKVESIDSIATEIMTFHTLRDTISPFCFTIMADSHLDDNADIQTYITTLLNASSDSADFHFDLGDTFMTDKYRENYTYAYNQYLAQRYYLGLLCKSSPLFFVQGNHDGETGQRLNGREENMTVWANRTRKRFFPNPEPDAFYTGNITQLPFVGLPQNYYAFEWGNALFITLDPFWNTPRSGNENPWDRTLGKQQYEWLRTTLENSKATFRFIFIHNLVGGIDVKGRARGGTEAATLYEWGGMNPDQTNGFKIHRPDWKIPIHELLVKHKVDVVFHGHDHLFAKQELDGVVYQCLPQPGAKEHGNISNGEEYGYTKGKFMNGPGYLRVSVTSVRADIEYVATIKSDGLNTKKSVYSYEVRR